ncbi:hypothetical protein GGR28_000047 [Lewinella aquimaris]|uniref:Uncharacterized protein n=1 Tax=Neolewinella aquimaris TaxID=1835722 RepID=A0A840E8Q7_9BACT|nr:hypothetical protein [Neolewinella aquimaris]MBB4077446.1 hypothetical protein [Neolewinella aquimaris]
MYNECNPSPNGTPSRPGHRLPEVVEHQSTTGEHDPPSTYAETDLASFKVFLKRNMRNQAPPAGLLDDIRARIAGIRTRK